MILMIGKFRTEFSIISHARMRIDLDHNLVSAAVVTLCPVFTVGNTALYQWFIHHHHPIYRVPGVKKGYSIIRLTGACYITPNT